MSRWRSAPGPTHGSVSSLRWPRYRSIVGRSDAIDAIIKLWYVANPRAEPRTEHRIDSPGARRKPFGIPHDGGDVGVRGEDECIGPGRRSHRRRCDDTGASRCRISYASYQCSCAPAEQVDVFQPSGQRIALRWWFGVFISLIPLPIRLPPEAAVLGPHYHSRVKVSTMSRRMSLDAHSTGRSEKWRQYRKNPAGDSIGSLRIESPSNSISLATARTG